MPAARSSLLAPRMTILSDVIRQWSLQRLGFIPRRTHPHVPLVDRWSTTGPEDRASGTCGPCQAAIATDRLASGSRKAGELLKLTARARRPVTHLDFK